MTFAELANVGYSRQSIRGLVSRGVLIRVRHGAYARAIAVAAAVAVAGPDAVASHEDAALLHGLRLFDRSSGALISVSRRGQQDRLLR
jgi:Transcriptional regulator, AbiEi antitoxin